MKTYAKPTVRASCWALVFSSVLLSTIMLCGDLASMGTSAPKLGIAAVSHRL